ncbi:ATP-binding protein [Streptomyces avermitilis]|uniref:ATP-binding protein n=1 Tax=Streptomyces avermitilis TaxID=33903 RepID=UPI00380DF294
MKTVTGREPRSPLLIQPSQGNPALCSVPAVAAAVPALRCFARVTARLWRLPDETEDALCMIVTELATNCVLHSGSPHIALLIAFTGNTVTVQIRDTGRWRPHECHPTDNGNAEHGRGLKLVHAYVNTCTVLPTRSGTLVIAEIPLLRPPAIKLTKSPPAALPDRLVGQGAS